MSEQTVTRPMRLLLAVALTGGLVAAPGLVLASSSTDAAPGGEPEARSRVERSDPPAASSISPAVPHVSEVGAVGDEAATPPAAATGPSVVEHEGERPGTDGPGTDRTGTDRPDRPQPERPGLGCEAQRSDPGPVVACRWTEVGPDRAAGYRLLRAVDDGPRAPIFQTRDLSQNGYRDGDVGPGHHYHYAVQYLAEDGRVLATSAPAHVRIPGDQPHPERLRLACQKVESDVEHGAVVGCKWSEATGDGLAGYRLIRRDADGREVIARGGPEFTAHRETVRPGRYAYLVVAVDSDGRVIAASEAVGVLVPHADRPAEPASDEHPDRRPDRPQVEPTDVGAG